MYVWMENMWRFFLLEEKYEETFYSWISLIGVYKNLVSLDSPCSSKKKIQPIIGKQPMGTVYVCFKEFFKVQNILKMFWNKEKYLEKIRKNT